MLNIQFIREHADAVQQNAASKGYDVNIAELLQIDSSRRELQRGVDELREQRNALSTQMKGGKPSVELIEQGKIIKDQIAAKEDELRTVEKKYFDLLKAVPNIALPHVPVGASENDNIVERTIGQPGQFTFEPLSHATLAQRRGWLDKERAAKVAGSRFAYIMGDAVKLQFALIQMLIDILSDQSFIDQVIAENNLRVSNKPFTPILPPYMIRTELYDAMDRLEPRDDRYKIEDEDLWLQGSAEHVLGSMHADEIFTEAELPVRYLGYATSFRREAGTYGKDMEGQFRLHQFDKLEMESLTTAEAGLDEHKFLIAVQEKIMQLLELPYRVLQKCTADIGKPNACGVDIEAWLPSQKTYRETHTADYMTDYQARRLNTRVRKADGGLDFIHTNDATCLPLSRGPIALIENHQRADGTITIPVALRPYMGGRETL